MKLHPLLLTVLLPILAATRVDAGVILTVDVSDTMNVVFTSTAEESQIDFTDDSNNGITLIDFFSGNANPTNSLADTGSIDVFDSNSATTRSSLNQVFIGGLSGGWTTDDVNFYSLTQFSTHFFTDERALAGSVTHDLSAMTNLPGVGSEGNIVAGEPNSGNVIGQWRVLQPASSVPEPGTFGMMLSCGLMALAGRSWRSRRRKGDLNAS